MNKPNLIIVENMLMPIRGTLNRIANLKCEVKSISNLEGQTGLFIMAVAFVESMHKEVLRYYLKYNPEKITNKKTIEISKVLLVRNEDFYILESLVDELIDKMSYWQSMKIFYEILKIHKPENLKTIESIQKYRNQIIHKNMQIEYKQGSVNHMFPDIDYILSSLSEYEKYLSDLNNKIYRKFSKFTRVNTLKNLWHYTFKTPFCKKFEDYWHIDLENDSIIGYKCPEYEKELSHSESFMLGIWRSQVSDCKVDFLNLSSLGKDVQSCLFMFLKLSNDIFMYK
ncbi:MAG: hypothetical protein CSA18_04945 [Deltaproteobacteria bacterium]|nr:MAG: hypothetical protein CSA18_04945 [Deltaproteobacteria bacterium]